VAAARFLNRGQLGAFVVIILTMGGLPNFGHLAITFQPSLGRELGKDAGGRGIPT